MDTNQTLAHLAAQMAELREALVIAERSAIYWKQEYEKMHEAVHHIEETNAAYAETVESMQDEIRGLEEEAEEVGNIATG